MKFKFIIMGLFFFSITGIIHAISPFITVTHEYMNDVFYQRTIKGEYQTSQLSLFREDEAILFCIEPGIPIQSLDYTIMSWEDTDFDPEIIRQLELIGFYGYNYENHQSKEYLLATQQLIWEALGVKNISFTTGNKAKENKIDINKYLNEIKTLIDNHYFEAPFYEDQEIHTNKNYQSNESEVYIGYKWLSNDNNESHLKIPIINSFNLTKTSHFKSIIYHNPKSQTLAQLGITEGQSHSIPKSTIPIGIINITHQISNDFLGDSSLNNGVYEIKNDQGFKTTITTNEAGETIIDGLEFGEYVIIQLAPPTGYLPDTKQYHIVIDSEHSEWDIDPVYQLITQDIIINIPQSQKTDYCPYEDLHMEVYNRNLLVRNILIDTNCQATITLPYGQYEIKFNSEKIENSLSINIDEKLLKNAMIIPFLINDKNIDCSSSPTTNNLEMESNLEKIKTQSKQKNKINQTATTNYAPKTKITSKTSAKRSKSNEVALKTKNHQINNKVLSEKRNIKENLFLLMVFPIIIIFFFFKKRKTKMKKERLN